jgi:hypothetical protein
VRVAYVRPKPRYKLIDSNEHAFLFIDVNTVGYGLCVTKYLMPRWRWAQIIRGEWPW